MSTQVMNKVIADYFKTQPVLKAWLFGSFARGEENEGEKVRDRGRIYTLHTVPVPVCTRYIFVLDLKEQ